MGSLTCRACLVVDESGRALWSRAASTPAPMASTTKMATALVAVARLDLDVELRVSASAAATPGGKLSLIAGETFSVRELLAALLLNSSNDAAVALAEQAGPEAHFPNVMNELAADLGARDTNFVNAHGLDAVGHESTARDLAILGMAVLREPTLAELVRTREMTIASDMRRAKLENTNLLLGDYVGAIGVKTGFTAEAGNVLVSAAEREGRTLIAVAMHSVDAFADAALLLDRGWAELERTVLVPRDAPVAELLAGEGSTVQVLTGARYTGSESRDGISVTFVSDPGLALPVAAGDVVGEVEVRNEGELLDSLPATAQESLSLPDQGMVERGLLGLMGLAGKLHGVLGLR